MTRHVLGVAASILIFAGPACASSALMNTSETARPSSTSPSDALKSAISGMINKSEAAAKPRYGELVLSTNDDDNTSQEVFAPDTPKIFLHAQLLNIANEKTSLGAVWIAEKTDAAPPNFKIDSIALNAGRSMNLATFSLSKPNSGWPVGEYRVELSIDGEAAQVVHFKVAQKA